MTKLDFNMNYIFLLFWLYSHQHAVYSNFICDEPEPRGDTSKTLTCETVEVEMNSQDCENFYKYFACAEKKKCQQLHRFLNKYEDCVPKHQPLKQNGRMSTVCSTNVLNGKDTSYFITDDKTFTEKGFWTSEHPCEENKVYMNSVSVTTSNFIKVDIPGEVFVQKSETASVSFTMMWNSSLFQNLTINDKKILNNIVIGVKLQGKTTKNLKKPVRLTFTHGARQHNEILQCVFWNMDISSWTTNGCETLTETNKTICECNHLTFFTILIEVVQPVLIIIYIGSSISAAFSLVTVILYFTFRILYKQGKSNNSNSILVSLSAALLQMNTAFLLNVAISPYTREGVTCRFLAVITHYYLLCCFCWMGIEGFQLYLLTIRIYNTYIKHFILKLSLIGWGVPAMVVIVTSLIKSSVYGYTNNSLPQCWIKTQTHRYITISGFFGVIFLFNLIILAVVCYKIFQIKSSAPQNEVQPTRWKEVCTILALSCLLGSTWAVVFILENLREPFTLYFFSTLNSLQGFFIFLWFCAMNCPSKAKETKQEGKVTLSAAVVTISSSQ